MMHGTMNIKNIKPFATRKLLCNDTM